MTQGPESKEHLNPTFKTISVFKIGDSYYLFQENEDGQAKLVYTDPQKDRVSYMRQTQELRPEHIHDFSDVEAGRVVMIDLGIVAPQVKWHERTGMNDEPTFTFTGTHAIKNQTTDFQISEKEVLDLFLTNANDPNKTASFFTADTLSHELIGIALKRQFPVLIFIRPGKENSAFSPKLGLVTFLNNIYQAYKIHLSSFQFKVDQAVFDQTGPDGGLRFPNNVQSETQRRQVEILKRIYQIKAILLAGRAENKTGSTEEALTDAELVQHAPYLSKLKTTTTTSTKQTNIFQRFALKKDVSVKEEYLVEQKLWLSLVSKVSGTLLTSDQSDTLYRPWQTGTNPTIQPTRTQEVVSPVKQPMLEPKSSLLPERRHEKPANTLSPKQEAVQDIREFNQELQAMFSLFGNERLDTFGPNEVALFKDRVTRLLELVRAYTKIHHRGVPPENPTQTVVLPKPSTLSVGGLQSEQVLAFLTGSEAKRWSDKMEDAFQAWQQVVLPLTQKTSNRFNRTLRALRKAGEMRSFDENLTNQIVAEFQVLFKDAEPHLNVDNADIAALAHILLMSQVLFVASEHYQNLRRNSNEVIEIHNWAAQMISVLNRISQLEINLK